MDEKAQRLAAADKLPGIGGAGTMSFDAYLNLRQPVRSYVLDHASNTCEEQSAMITGMHEGRYRVRSGNKACHQPPSALRDRYEMEDGLRRVL